MRFARLACLVLVAFGVAWVQLEGSASAGTKAERAERVAKALRQLQSRSRTARFNAIAEVRALRAAEALARVRQLRHDDDLRIAQAAMQALPTLERAAAEALLARPVIHIDLRSIADVALRDSLARSLTMHPRFDTGTRMDFDDAIAPTEPEPGLGLRLVETRRGRALELFGPSGIGLERLPLPRNANADVSARRITTLLAARAGAPRLAVLTGD